MNAPPSDQRRAPLVRLGTLDSGPVARAGTGATAATPGGDVVVEWWIGAEDRWHRPATDASTRDRLIGGRPVAEARVRIPSGDAVGTVAGGRLDGSPLDAVLFDVHNDSPLPVALAYVVTSDRPMMVDGGGIAVPGVGALRLTRPAMGWAGGSTPDEVLASLGTDELGSPPDGATVGNVAAVLVPLPHTAHGVAAFELDPEPATAPVTASVATAIDRSRVPGPDRIGAGWTVHLAGIPSFDPGTPAAVEAYEAAVCDLLLGPDEAGPESLTELGRRVEALARIGRTDDPTPLVDLLDHRRSGGAIGPRGSGRTEATLQFVRAVAAWITAVGPGDVADELVGPLVQAAHWSAAARRAADAATVDDLGRTGADAWAAAVAALVPVGQAEAAAALRSLVASRVDPAAVAGTGSAATARGAGAAGVLRHLDRAARVADDGVLIAPGWGAADAGAGWEAHDIATPFGAVSYAIRWHGERPALLWEIDEARRAGETPAEAAPVVVRAPAVDAAWSSTEHRGEALLAAVAGRRAPTDENGQTDAPVGGSFS